MIVTVSARGPVVVAMSPPTSGQPKALAHRWQQSKSSSACRYPAGSDAAQRVCVGVPAIAAMSTPGLLWVIAGGLAYSVGVVFFLWEGLKYNHAVWHLFVLAGSTCHVMAMVTDVLPRG